MDKQEAGERFVAWLERKVVRDARGDDLEHLSGRPSERFWLGRLAPESEVEDRGGGERGMRLDPCACGFRFLPNHGPPWAWEATISARCWLPAGTGSDRTWAKQPAVEFSVPIDIADARRGVHSYGLDPGKDAFASAGLRGFAARVDVEIGADDGVAVTVVNCSEEKRGQDRNLFEVKLTLSVGATTPFKLDALPDSFRYDRNVAAYGLYGGVDVEDGALRTTDVVSATRLRPTYWDNSLGEPPDLSFKALASDPISQLRRLVGALERWGEEHWSDEALEARARDDRWSAEMLTNARDEAERFSAEVSRCEAGVDLLETDADARDAFVYMNEAFQHSGERRGYAEWRPFQIGFLLCALPSTLNETSSDRDVVDTLWFATGGGKTETYLALIVTTCFYDRLRGKAYGVSAWSRFPLRMLSLQQTQRFADAMAGAELVRRRHELGGDVFRLGFLAGSGDTPNRIVETPDSKNPWAYDEEMPKKYRVLFRCPFCWDEALKMRFDLANWTLVHTCTNSACPWSSEGEGLPFHLVDEEIFRFLPAAVVGTLDKAALVAFMTGMRGLYGAPLGRCGIPHHGFTYAQRKRSPNGCFIARCPSKSEPIPEEERRLYPPSLRVQDELHLLRDSVGAIDSHYETLLNHLARVCGGVPPKIVASSATLSGFEEQVAELYCRGARSFPIAGPREGASFWTRPTPDVLRRFVGLAPRGVTREFANDRVAESLQRAIRELIADPSAVLMDARIENEHAAFLISFYGTHVVYGTRLGDVEAAVRSLTTQPSVEGLNVAKLTGGTLLDEVQSVLERLDAPEEDFADRLHTIVASSMMSHGVDVDRFNVITLLGAPLQTAEFIQTTARIGRRWPGLVFVLHRMAIERDASVYRSFPQYVDHGNRFVAPVSITRRSRRVLDLTFAGLVEARRLAVWDPERIARMGRPVAWHRDERAWAVEKPLLEEEEFAQLCDALCLDPAGAEPLVSALRALVRKTFAELNDPASRRDRITPRTPMFSLRQVEDTVPIHLI